MPKSAPIITAFNAGEFSPLLAGRPDLKYYRNGCRRMRNFVPTVQGPARRRAGTRFVAEVKDSTVRTWLRRFEFNVEQAYILEFGHLYIRFFSNHGVVGAPFEVVTPYTAADLISDQGTFNLRFVQSGDVLYIVHPDHKPQKLTRTGAATFTLAPLDQTGGPFKDMDPDETTTVWASANTGAITLNASAAIFQTGHIGSLFYMQQKDVDAVTQWETGVAIGGAGQVRKSDGKNYTSLNAATTGTVRPTHSRGAKYDGNAGVQWQFNDAGYGWCRIDAVGGGGTTANATVLSRIPDNAVGAANATTRWAHGAWSGVEGWPDYVTFFKERLVFARSRKGWGSVAGDFEDFRDRDDGGLVTADMAITFDITSDRANRIEWLAPSDTALLVGTAGDESAVSEITNTEAFGAGNIAVKKQTEHGSKRVPVVRVGDSILFAQKSGRKIRIMKLAESVETRYIANDATILAEHVTAGGIVDMVYQQEPDTIVWVITSAGRLVGFTFNQEQDVRGWHPHRIGGFADSNHYEFAAVESLATIPAPAGNRDELWMIVRRTINGTVRRYVEWVEYGDEEGDDPEAAFYVDSGLSLNNSMAFDLTPGAGADIEGTTSVVFNTLGAVFVPGDVGRFIHSSWREEADDGTFTWRKGVAEITGYTSNVEVTCTINKAFRSTAIIAAADWRLTVTTISGLGHLEGEEVQVCIDGADHTPQTVNAGTITLDTPASKVHVGLKCTAVISPMPLEAGAADGTAQGKTARISRCIIRFNRTLGAKYGRDESNQLDEVKVRGPGDDMDTAPPLFTGDKIVSWPKGYEGQALITIVQDKPHPCTVVALMPQVTVQDAR